MTDEVTAGYYRWLDFNNPMTDRTADDLVAKLIATKPSHVLDIGCGWAELLLRLLTACPEATGHGVDHDELLIERAKRNAAGRQITSRVTFSEELGDQQPTDLVINVGAEHVFGTIGEALGELHRLVLPGGRLLLGTQFWEAPPTTALIEAIGELPTLEGLIDLTVGAGFRPLDLVVSSAQDWDHFELAFIADWEQVVMAAPNSAAGQDARRSADEHRAAYLERRGVLGFALLTLGRPPD